METTTSLLGVDLGGSKIEAAIMDAAGVVTHRARCPTPKNSYEDTLAAIRELCEQLESETGLPDRRPLGICTPGSPSPETGLMRNCNSTALNGQRLLADLEDCCARPVRIANDADCLALSEASDGSGAEADSVFGVIVGTGVGGGIVIRGSLLQGPNAISGEWGHNPMPLDRLATLPPALSPSRLCYCGRQNCIETWLSGPGLALSHEQLHGDGISVGELSLEHPDDAHRASLSLYADMLATALGGVVNLLDPELIVMGGGLSNIPSLYREVPALLARKLFSDVCRTKIYPAQHGDSSGVRGAAWLWRDTVSASS
ncbi:ROK family protein [Congregibacter litoralis]|uniref:N-acetylglucosamine kinase n=1 Tax=Congregibacter litoralis KT71 TaxID=314285 RepID=A4ADI8_9GAMM|nr:ROK family protein [Congregibacter litoralis]EAQ95986.2 N-acetylglucosamine kinase [Congregibacter litoralis KT71]